MVIEVRPSKSQNNCIRIHNGNIFASLSSVFQQEIELVKLSKKFIYTHTYSDLGKRENKMQKLDYGNTWTEIPEDIYWNWKNNTLGLERTTLQ